MKLKFKLLHFALGLIILTTYFSCQKTFNLTDKDLKGKSDNDFIMEAKSFFNKEIMPQTIINTSVVNSSASKSNKINHIRNLAKELRWDKAAIVQLSNCKAVLVPIFFSTAWNSRSNLTDTSITIPINSISKLLIYKNQEGLYQSEVVSAYPDSNFVRFASKTFSGITMIQNWNGDFLNGFKFDNEKTWKLSLLDSSAQEDSTANNSAEINTQANYLTTCYYNDWYTCYGGSTCIYDYTEELGCTTTPIVGSGDQIVNTHDYNVISSGNPTSAPSSVNTINNLLTNACFKAVLNNMISGGLQSELTSILVNTFGTSNTLSLTFKNLAYPATYADAISNGTAGDNPSISITLNSTVLQNSSKEFVTETIFHEVIHAYLNVNTTLRGTMPQHCEMITSYVDCELAALRELFPTLSSHDGLCMILGGMGDVQQYDATTLNTVLSTYNLTLNDVVATNNNYKSANLGHGCGL